MILGSILGSSITGWIVSISSLGSGSGITQILSVTNFISVIAIIGIFLRKFRKRTFENDIGTLLLGFVILMTGMSAMSASVEPLQSDERFLSLMVDFSNPLLGLLIGLLFTALIQSSAAAVGILQALSTTGVITFNTAFPVILGIAIGGAIPVLLGVLGGNANAKRAASLHLIMDILGALFCGIVFYAVDSALNLAFADSLMNPVSIAAVNTAFRLVTIIILMPLVPLLVKLTHKLVKEVKEKANKSDALSVLDESFIKYPSLALAQCQKAMHDMAKCASEGVLLMGTLLESYNGDVFARMEKLETKCDKYEDAVSTYLMKIMRYKLNTEEDVEATLLMHEISDFERISDYAMNIAHISKEMRKQGTKYSAEAQHELSVMHRAVCAEVEITITAFETKSANDAKSSVILAGVIDDMCEEMRLHHVRRLQTGACTAELGITFNDTLSNMESILDRCRKLSSMILKSTEGKIGVHGLTQKNILLGQEWSAEVEKEYRERFLMELMGTDAVHKNETSKDTAGVK